MRESFYNFLDAIYDVVSISFSFLFAFGSNPLFFIKLIALLIIAAGLVWAAFLITFTG